MSHCQKCQSELTRDEVKNGRCDECGAEIEMASDDGVRGSFADFSLDSGSSSAQSRSSDSNSGSVDADNEFGSGMTSESDLAPPLRTILDPERTMGMNDEDLRQPAPDATEMRDSVDAGDLKSSIEVSSHQSSSSPSKDSGGSRSDSGDTPVNVRLRRLARAGSDSGALGSGSGRKSDGGTGSSDSEPGTDLDPDSDSPQLADYIIEKKLGEGGMGEVWIAHQTSLNRKVALKQIRSDKLEKASKRAIQSARRKFLFEAVVTGDLEHPNIVPIYDMGSDEKGNLLYSMKRVHGKSWDRVIRKKTLSDNIEILRRISSAIAFAHERGIIHRDLKPHNIMVGEFDEVLVLDWGTALPLAKFKKHGFSRSAVDKAGTPAYMSPEQASGDISSVGPHSDIYLLGAILFEIVTGFPPHPYRDENGKSLTTDAVLEKASANEIVRVAKPDEETDERTSAYSKELLEIALVAMRTEPRDRYRTVEEFIQALKDYQNNYQKHAESMALVAQAKKDLKEANQKRDYTLYARAVFGFENAAQLWKAHTDASEGLITAKLDYADAAREREDFDLGLSLVNFDHTLARSAQKKLLRLQQERKKRDARLVAVRRIAAILLFILIGGGSIGGYFIHRQSVIVEQANEQLKEANGNLTVEKENVLKEKRNVEEQSNLAKANEAKALRNAEKANENAAEAIQNQMNADLATKKAMENLELAEANRKTAEANRKTAEANQKTAEANQKKADASAIEAMMAAKLAEMRKLDAERQTAIAEKAAAAEKIAKDEVVRESYYSQINLADQQIAQNAFDSAREILAGIDAALKSEKEPNLASQIGWEFQRLKYICSLASDNDKIELGDIRTPLTAVAASRKFLATANVRGEIQIWDNSPRKKVHTLQTSEHIGTMVFSPDDTTLAVGNSSGQITIWDTKAGKSLGVLTDQGQAGHTDEITQLMYLPEGSLVSASRDRTVRVWNVKQKTSVILKGHIDAVLSVAAIVDQSNIIGLVTGDSNRGNVRFWKWPVSNGSQSEELPLDESSAITALAAECRGDLNTVFVGTEDGNLKVLQWKTASDLKKNAISRSLTRQQSDKHQGGITRLLIDPANPGLLISTSRDNTARTWDVGQASLLRDSQSLLQQVLRGHGNAIIDAAVWSDLETKKTRMLTASADGTARLWQPGESAEIVSLGGEPLDRELGSYGEVVSVSAAGAKGEQVMGISRDGIATIWTRSPSPPPTTARSAT